MPAAEANHIRALQNPNAFLIPINDGRERKKINELTRVKHTRKPGKAAIYLFVLTGDAARVPSAQCLIIKHHRE